MKPDIKRTNQIIMVIAIILIVIAVIALPFLNEAQRIVVGIGLAFCLLNLAGTRYFFNRNTKHRR